MQESRREPFKIPAFLLSLEIDGQVKTIAGRESHHWRERSRLHPWTLRDRVGKVCVAHGEEDR